MEHSPLALAGPSAAVALGAATQRVTGLGFALVASPFVVLVLGPFTRVLLINSVGPSCAAFSRCSFVGRLTSDTHSCWPCRGILAVLPGAWLARQAPAAVLQVAVGACVVIAILALLAVDRRAGLEPDEVAPLSRAGALSAGAASGFMNAVAGVGGPAVTVYAVATRWQQRSFAATAQLVFMAVSIASLTAKAPPTMPARTWLAAAGALAMGLFVGHRIRVSVSVSVSVAAARRAVVGVALVGGAVSLVQGVVELVGSGDVGLSG